MSYGHAIPTVRASRLRRLTFDERPAALDNSLRLRGKYSTANAYYGIFSYLEISRRSTFAIIRTLQKTS